MKNFDPPADTYGHNSMGVSDAEWKARVDLAATYRLCVYYGLHEGIVNHLTVRCSAGQVPDGRVRGYGLGDFCGELCSSRTVKCQ